MKSTILELASVAAFVAFAAVTWWPACLLVLGIAALLMSLKLAIESEKSA